MPDLFNGHGFGPPGGVTLPSTCPWVDHKVSRLPPATRRPFQTRFRSASGRDSALGSPHRLTRGLIMQKARRHPEGAPTACKQHGFRYSFTPLIGVLFNVQSPYWFAIGRRVVLSLGGWTPHVQAGFHESDSTQGLTSNGYTGLSPSMVELSSSFTPQSGLSAFARRY
jgi:hypothetical protein